MRDFSIEENLQRVLAKLAKKDKALYGACMRKMDEILNCENLDHYKNLRNPLQEFKRVHIKGPFVLIFKYLPAQNKVLFFELNHHDRIYAN